MIITFPVLARTRPNGGAMAIYEFANAMCRRGHEVHLVHIGWHEHILQPGDLPWMDFEGGIQHVFPSVDVAEIDVSLNPGEDRMGIDGSRLAQLARYLPDADFIAAWDDQVPARHGLQFVFVQGYRIFIPATEEAMFQTPCPKICVSRWLVEVGKEKGAPPDELVHVSNGLNHSKYRVVSPLETRPPLVSTTYRANRQTRPEETLAVLGELKRRTPEMEAVLFSPAPPEHEIMPWVTVMTNPPQQTIVNEIYNRSRVFLCASRYEGFGFPSVEAMACGAALVTAANGGSDDYALHGETALVCEPDDVAGMADQVERLLRDDDLRLRIARQGTKYVRETFSWDTSAAKLDAFLDEYAADPARYTRR